MAASTEDILREVREFREEFHVYRAARDSDCAAHQRDTTEMRGTLYGNGQPGLKATVERLATNMRLVSFLSGAAVTAALGCIGTVIAVKLMG